MIQNTIVCAPDELREILRKMTRMQSGLGSLAAGFDRLPQRNLGLPDYPEIPWAALSRTA